MEAAASVGHGEIVAVFGSQCQTAHEELLAGKCPWCGRVVVYGRALPLEWTSESRTIRLEFHGGFKDGQVVIGNTSVQGEDTPLLWRYLYLTDEVASASGLTRCRKTLGRRRRMPWTR
jgi:hypothetical protein